MEDAVDILAAPKAGMLQVSLIWMTYLIAVGLSVLVSLLTVFAYRSSIKHERSAFATGVAIFTLTCLLATALLLPVDIALVSATGDAKLGRKKDWAAEDPERVESMLNTLRAVYYALYSVDAVCCLLVIPFAYFWWEEGDEVESDEDGPGAPGRKGAGARILGALKYTTIFLVLVVTLFLVGFFVPAAGGCAGGGNGAKHGKCHLDLDFFRRLLAENRGERALTFAVGLLVTLGTLLYVVYTGAGLALLPVDLVKSAPPVSAPQLSETTTSALERNRERQRQLEMRSAGAGAMSAKDRRELEALMREERTLVRRERLAAEARGEGRSVLYRAWLKVSAVLRPLKLLGGILLVLVSMLVWVSILLTGIDKAANSICGARCGYILGHAHIAQPINLLLLASARAFPVDYALTALLVLFLFAASVCGIAAVGIRFLWLRIFALRRRRTPPQALLIAAVLLALVVLALNYSVAMLLAPSYAAFGTQTFCAALPDHPLKQPDCTDRPDLVRPCSEAVASERVFRGKQYSVCTPTLASTILNRAVLNWPVFGAVQFWAQFAFLGMALIVFVTALIRTPRFDWEDLDEEAEEEEEEGLLAATSRRFGAAWQDVTGRTGGHGRYKATGPGNNRNNGSSSAAHA